MERNWKGYEGKKVYVKLRNGSNYKGIVLEVESIPGSPLSFLTIKDIYNKRIGFCSSEVIQIEEK